MFAKIADGRDEEERALAVLRWFIVMPVSCPLHVLSLIHPSIGRVHSKANIPRAMNPWDPRKSESITSVFCMLY